MASYKVIQDIEAEDKLLGPLTLRQSVYGFIAGCCIFLSYFSFSRGAGFMVIFFLPPAVVGSFFAFPWSHEQSTEVWALGRIRFMFKPRKRIWDQSGIKELVTVTVPKRLERIYTDGLSQNEVRSRLQALASTIDSRGWATKNTTNPYANSYITGSTDRLLGINNLPQEVSPTGSEVYTDMLDSSDNRVAQQFDAMLSQNAQAHHQQLVTSLQQPIQPQALQEPPASSRLVNGRGAPTPPVDFWFLNGPTQANDSTVITPSAPQPVTTQAPFVPLVAPVIVSPDEEQALMETLRERAPGPAYEYSHLPTILPLAEREKLEKQEAEQRVAAQAAEALAHANTSAMTEKHDTAILELAGNDDLNVETIARQFNKKSQTNDDEVVISLH